MVGAPAFVATQEGLGEGGGSDTSALLEAVAAAAQGLVDSAAPPTGRRGAEGLRQGVRHRPPDVGVEPQGQMGRPHLDMVHPG